MDITQRFLTGSDCYRSGRTIVPKGVMVHSLGVAQPDPEVFIRQWNRPGVEAAVHAIVSADGVTQLLPWDRRGWHAGTGTSGQSANNTHISFECCEPAGHTYQGGTMIGYAAEKNAAYFAAIYRNAVDLTVWLCRKYSLDPLAGGVVICHAEGYRQGIASNHADVLHWWPLHGKDMDDFRADVAAGLKGDETGMTEDSVRKLVDAAVLAARPPVYTQPGEVPEWARELVRRALEKGILQGDGSGQLHLTADNLVNLQMLANAGLF